MIGIRNLTPPPIHADTEEVDGQSLQGAPCRCQSRQLSLPSVAPVSTEGDHGDPPRLPASDTSIPCGDLKRLPGVPEHRVGTGEMEDERQQQCKGRPLHWLTLISFEELFPLEAGRLKNSATAGKAMSCPSDSALK